MSKLKKFLEKRELRRQESFKLKAEEISCPDCKTTLYKGGNGIIPCICYGEHCGKKITIKKSENGNIKLNFPKKFNIANIEMLLDALKKQ